MHFFTDNTQFSNPQTSGDAFGPQPNSGSNEVYSIENNFDINSGAPVFAVTKGVVFYSTGATPDVVNVALKPLNQTSAGFPIAYFIFRGIERSSLLDANDKIQIPDSSWSSSNILQIVQSIQNKINEQNQSNEQANLDSLGLQFDSDPADTLLDKYTLGGPNDFHALIVPEGCQLGKLMGGASSFSVQVVFNTVTSQPDLEMLKQASTPFLRPIFVPDTSATPEQQTKALFIERNEREYILDFMDITAFYGSCRNQGITITGMPDDDFFLDKFANNQRVYIDLREERGFSYNHFLDKNDVIKAGMYPSSGTNVTFQPLDYYRWNNQNWPILTVDNYFYNSGIEHFQIILPIKLSTPEHIHIFTSYTNSVRKKGEYLNGSTNIPLAIQTVGTVLASTESEPLEFHNWAYTNGSLGSNYFLCKLSILGDNVGSTPTHPILSSYFDINMRNPFGDAGIEDGEYRIQMYSSLNGPVVADEKMKELHLSLIGIAFDKFHVTFFSVPEDEAFSFENTRFVNKVGFTGGGIFKVGISSNESNYNPTNQGLGFLYQSIKGSGLNNVKLKGYSFLDTNSQEKKLITYAQSDADDFKTLFLRKVSAITMTHDEYNALKNEDDSGLADDFIIGHRLFLKGKRNQTSRYEKFTFFQEDLTLGVPRLLSDGTDYSVFLDNHPDEIEESGENITTHWADSKNLF